MAPAITNDKSKGLFCKNAKENIRLTRKTYMQDK
jgi:hypothetical protein